MNKYLKEVVIESMYNIYPGIVEFRTWLIENVA